MFCLLVTGSFAGFRMAGGAFELLNAGGYGPECAKQPKICLADIWRFLSIQPLRGVSWPLQLGVNCALSLICG